MSAVALTVGEFSRGLPNFLSQVQYQVHSLDILRSKKAAARMLPAAVSSGFPIDQLDDALAKGPQLKASGRLAVAEDVRSLRTGLKAQSDPRA